MTSIKKAEDDINNKAEENFSKKAAPPHGTPTPLYIRTCFIKNLTQNLSDILSTLNHLDLPTLNHVHKVWTALDYLKSYIDFGSNTQNAVNFLGNFERALGVYGMNYFNIFC
jgi:hypothetical protein